MSSLKKIIRLLCFFSVLLSGCTPKITEPTTATEAPAPPPPVNTENLSHCKNWVGSPLKDKAETLHVLYKDRLRENNYTEAMRLWKEVFEIAPAADGKRPDHYLDGIKLYAHLYSQTADKSEKDNYVKNIMELYDEAANCYPKGASLYTGLKAFDLYYKYPEYATDMERYQLFKKAIDAEGKEADDFLINPFTSLMIQLFLDEKIPLSEAQKYAELVPKIIEHGMSEAKTAKAKDRWEIVNSYAPVRLEELEGIEGFYDCKYYKDKYFAEYQANKNDCEIVATTYGRLKWGKCSETDAMLVSLKPKIEECFPPAEVKDPVVTCSSILREGNYMGAINCYDEKAQTTSDNETKALYLITMAKIYYAHLKRFSQARQYALQAAEAKPNWGEPYILIGKLYASSGPLCGPGRGWDSQIVTWPAIDMWIQAKSVDSSNEVAKEANRLIARYQQFMPSKEDIFQRNLQEGDSFTVGCWIQRSTRIRAAVD